MDRFFDYSSDFHKALMILFSILQERVPPPSASAPSVIPWQRSVVVVVKSSALWSWSTISIVIPHFPTTLQTLSKVIFYWKAHICMWPFYLNNNAPARELNLHGKNMRLCVCFHFLQSEGSLRSFHGYATMNQRIQFPSISLMFIQTAIRSRELKPASLDSISSFPVRNFQKQNKGNWWGNFHLPLLCHQFIIM